MFRRTRPRHAVVFIRRRLALVACELALLALVVTPPARAQRAPAGPGCSPPLVPVGQVSPDPVAEPLAPAWCLTLQPEPISAVQGPNEWLDEFETDVNTGRLNDLDMGYRVFDNLSNTGSTLNGQVRSQHFVNQNHWVTDFTRNNGGADLSPNRSFHFENGKLIIEAEVAATYAGYGSDGDVVWPEIEWSTAPAPTGQVVDGLYMYGQFGGNWVGGCRVQARRSLTCAVQADHTLNVTANDQPPCFQASPTRVMEISGFQQCGSSHFGGSVDFGAPSNAWRICQANQDNWFCRDRFRFEWTRSSLTVYINGILFLQDADWPSFAQLPDHVVSGNTPVYAHFGEWGDFSDSNVYRIHWGYLHINPHDDHGNFAAPSAAESFCPDQPFQTCPIPGESEGLRPPPLRTPTPTPSPRPSTPAPTLTPPPAPARSPTRGPAASGPLVGNTAVQGTIDTRQHLLDRHPAAGRHRGRAPVP